MAIEINGKVYRNLQEQVGKNQEDIELLKQRPAMHTEVVEELPEVGEEGIIYLVAKEDAGDSDIYNEYVWTGEAFEFIGNTSTDISNMVTLDTDQTITGVKTFGDDTTGKLIVQQTGIEGSPRLEIVNSGWTTTLSQTGGAKVRLAGSGLDVTGYVAPITDNSYDLGRSSQKWKDLYLSGTANIGNDSIDTNASNDLRFNINGTNRFIIASGSIRCDANLLPANGTTRNLGSSSTGYQWKDLYLGGTANIGSYKVFTDGAGYFAIHDSSNINCLQMYHNNWIMPGANNTMDLGYSTRQWKNFYVAGNISDGTNSVTVAEIAAGLGTPTLTATASGTVVTINVPKNILPDYIELSVNLSGTTQTIKIYKEMSSSGVSYGTSGMCHMNAVLGDAASTYIALDFDQDDSVSSPTIAGFTYSHMKDITVTISY